MIERIKCVGAFVGAALYVIVVCAILALSAVGAFARDADGNPIVLGGQPRGCPYRFCGCEASLFLFGKIIPPLNLAANWLRFPRTQPAYHMAAVRRGGGHVMILLHQVEGKNWLVHDGNSGGHKTREHVRSIAGYIIVNPNARVAMGEGR